MRPVQREGGRGSAGRAGMRMAAAAVAALAIGCSPDLKVGGPASSGLCDDGVKNGDEADVDCGGSCPDQCAPGQRCGAALDCGTGHCAGGLCCGTPCDGACQSCSAVLKGAGFDGECGPLPAGTSCGAQQGCASGVETRADACDGAGTCVEGGTLGCAPYPCGSTACETTCASGNDCANEHFCDTASHCVPLKPIGEICQEWGECVSGFCSDMVCCDVDCGGECNQCDSAGSSGTCTAVPPGEQGDCAGGKVCDAIGQCVAP